MEFWRFLAIGGLSAGLWFTLLEHAWWIRSMEQVTFRNSLVDNQDHLLRASGLELPIPLLDVNTRTIATTLLEGEGPIAHASVQRRMAPPRLLISLQHRTAHAYAARFDREAQENGFLDVAGRWFSVPRDYEPPAPVKRDAVTVEGWRPGLQEPTAHLLFLLKRVETPVEKIRFTADGKLSLLTSSALGEVKLGDPSNLDRKLAILDHIHAQLTTPGSDARYAMVDLRNPEQPELGLP